MNGVLIQTEVVVCAYMTGVIWLIQLVHYPSFFFVEGTRFREFSILHQNRMGFIVGGPMLVELFTACYSLFFDQSFLIILAMILLAIIWYVTFFVSVPLHSKLSRGWDEVSCKRLVQTNWWRTMGWSLRLVILLVQYNLALNMKRGLLID